MKPIRRIIPALLLLVHAPGTLWAVDDVLLRRDGREVRVSGKLLVEAQDGGLLLESSDGVLWAVQPEELAEHTRGDGPFAYLDKDALGKSLLAELPEGFRIHTTANYVVCYNTSKAYAQWCGALYERLYRGFYAYWTHRGCKLREPDLPLVALVFDTKASYARYAQAELGEATDSIIGYYSLRTNRVTMYDLTGIESLRQYGGRPSSSAQINRILSRPEAERTVATIIHEATHQLSFNCGLQTRYADIPLWVSEGIAVFFETPDLKSRRGWSTIGAVNRVRLVRFRQYLARRPDDSLKTLMSDDGRFRNVDTALDAYSEAWALNYYLIRHYPKQYVEYLQRLSTKQALMEDGPEQRADDFKAFFGDDLKALDVDFLRQMQRVR